MAKKEKKLTMKEVMADLKRSKGLRLDEGDIQEQLDKVVKQLPDSPDKDYWSSSDLDVAAIMAKYKLPQFKPQPVEVTVACPHCGRPEKLLIPGKGDIERLADNWRCQNEDCPHHEVRFPFGKFRDCIVAKVYKQQPGYVAWFLDAIETESAEIRAVKAEIEKLPGIAEHLAKYRTRQAEQEHRSQQQPWTGHIRLSPASLDNLCDRLFNGE